MIRLTAHFAGRVQGVGFRYTTTRVAGRYAVTGYVQNLDDGRVKLVAEGDRKEVDALLKDVQAAMGRNIRDTTVGRDEATGEFDGFGVRR